jgi:hypothetical protein
MIPLSSGVQGGVGRVGEGRGGGVFQVYSHFENNNTIMLLNQ